MAYPKFVEGGPLTINGQSIKMHNNSSGSATHSYTVNSIYGKPVQAHWKAGELHFTTDKGRYFISKDNNNITEVK